MKITDSEARDSLETVARVQQEAFAPRPIPLWYWLVLGSFFAVVWTAVDINNIAVTIIVTAIGAVGLGAAMGVLLRRQRMTVRMSSMPRSLKWASLRTSVLFLLAFAVIAAIVFGANLGHPWLWMAGAGFVLSVVGGPLGVRSYANSYDRWKAGQS